MNKEEISQAKELIGKMEHFEMKINQINSKIQRIDEMIDTLNKNRKNLINQTNLINRSKYEVSKEFFSLIGQNTCYLCNNDKCAMYKSFSSRCDKYDNGAPF